MVERQSNAVFNQQDKNEQHHNMPTGAATSTQDRMSRDFGFTIPHVLVPLPSKGIVYPPESCLHNKEVVEIKAMTAKEEDILTSQALIKKGTFISELIKSCVVDKSFDPADLLIGDRNALMVAIRITGYGHEFPATVKCTSCEKSSERTFNLAELPIRGFSENCVPVIPNRNMFEFMLPQTKQRVWFSFLTAGVEAELSTVAEKRTKALGSVFDETVTNALFTAIYSINGETDRSKIRFFVQNMPAYDSKALRSFIKSNEPGIQFDQMTTCKFCSNEEEVSVNLDVNFFWPKS